MNARGAVRYWWTHFVDRSVLKTLISVFGSRTDSRLAWDDYAAFSRLPNLKAIQDNVKSLGVARVCLNRNDMSSWGNVTVEELLPSELLANWGAIQNEPISVQEALVAPLVRSAGFGRSPLATWEAYTHLKSARSHWKPRELNMLLEVAGALHRHDDFAPVRVPKLPLSACVGYIDKCVWLWRNGNNTSYRRWSVEAQNEWAGMCKDILSASVSAGRFTVPSPTHGNTQKWERLRALHEKTLLEQATACAQGGSSTVRRRAM